MKAIITAEAGILTRGQLVRELQKGCDSLDVTLIINEQKGWLESYFKFTLIGEKSSILKISNWMKSLCKEVSIMDKSYVSMEACPICQQPTGTILMDRRLKDSMERYTINPTAVCDDCKAKYLDKGVMLINPQTCRLSVIKDEAFKRIFDKPLPPKKIAFCDEEVFVQLGL